MHGKLPKGCLSKEDSALIDWSSSPARINEMILRQGNESPQDEDAKNISKNPPQHSDPYSRCKYEKRGLKSSPLEYQNQYEWFSFRKSDSCTGF